MGMTAPAAGDVKHPAPRHHRSDPGPALAQQPGGRGAGDLQYFLDQSPEDELLPACLEHKVGVLACVPLDEDGLNGTITSDTQFPEGDWCNNYFRDDRKHELHERGQAIVRDLKIELEQLPEAALRYILSHPAVSTVIPGMRRVRNIKRNVAVGAGQGVPSAQVQLLKRHRWIRDYYK